MRSRSVPIIPSKLSPARTRINSSNSPMSAIFRTTRAPCQQQDSLRSTGALGKGETKTVKFDKPGIYYYICTPHPWMYGQVIVE